MIGLIADHLELAGEREEALRHLRWAGQAAAGKYANDEAIDYFTRALAIVLEADLETRFELLLAREKVLELQAKREQQRQDLQVLEILANKLESAEKQLEANDRWSLYLLLTNDLQAAVETAALVVERAEMINNLHFAARGQLRWGYALIWMSQYEIAQEHLDQALAGFKTIRDQRMVGVTLRYLGMLAADLYDLQAWQEYAQQALGIARQIGDKVAEANAINHLGNIFTHQGDYLTAQKHFNQYLALSREIGDKNQEMMALANLGWAAHEMLDYQTALDYYMQSLEVERTIGTRLLKAASLTGLGKALAGLEQWNEATQVFLRAKDLYEKIGIEWGIADSRTGLARTALAQGDVVKALGIVESILDYLERGEGRGQIHQPILSYLICIQVLRATGDPRASEVLERGYIQLQEWAAKIKDPEVRISFLENVPYNRELVNLWEEQQEQQG